MTREQSITENVEKLQKYVGSTIEVEITTMTEGCVITPLRVVGYNPRRNELITDGGEYGWTELDGWDLVAIRCDTYWYMSTDRIINVL